MPKRKPITVKMRIRIYAGDLMLGPGKMELLAHIDGNWVAFGGRQTDENVLHASLDPGARA